MSDNNTTYLHETTQYRDAFSRIGGHGKGLAAAAAAILAGRKLNAEHMSAMTVSLRSGIAASDRGAMIVALAGSHNVMVGVIPSRTDVSYALTKGYTFKKLGDELGLSATVIGRGIKALSLAYCAGIAGDSWPVFNNRVKMETVNEASVLYKKGRESFVADLQNDSAWKDRAARRGQTTGGEDENESPDEDENESAPTPTPTPTASAPAPAASAPAPAPTASAPTPTVPNMERADDGIRESKNADNLVRVFKVLCEEDFDRASKALAAMNAHMDVLKASMASRKLAAETARGMQVEP